MQEAMLAPVLSRAAMIEQGRGQIGKGDLGRRLTDWVELGVIPAPVKRGLGRGQGSISGWSTFAVNLWRTQLACRVAGLDIAALCNAPVGLWVYDDGSPVTTRQVQRALHTWAVRRVGRRSGHLRISADRTISRAAYPRVSAADRRRLVGLLKAAPASAHPEVEIPPMVRQVVAPGAAGRKGSPRWRVAGWLSTEVLAQVLGAQLLVQAGRDGLAVSELEPTRLLVRHATAGHAADADRARAIARSFGAPAPLMGIDRIGMACLDITEVLGTIRLHELGVLGDARR